MRDGKDSVCPGSTLSFGLALYISPAISFDWRCGEIRTCFRLKVRLGSVIGDVSTADRY